MSTIRMIFGLTVVVAALLLTGCQDTPWARGRNKTQFDNYLILRGHNPESRKQGSGFKDRYEYDEPDLRKELAPLGTQ